MLTSYPVNYPEMVVKKSEGLTISEKKLVALGYRTFLRLWSYPNPYKMQKNGKELCDLLIVFDNHIIIFQTRNVYMVIQETRRSTGGDGIKGQSKNLRSS